MSPRCLAWLRHGKVNPTAGDFVLRGIDTLPYHTSEGSSLTRSLELPRNGPKRPEAGARWEHWVTLDSTPLPGWEPP
jgi:hypothetical protein